MSKTESVAHKLQQSTMLLNVDFMRSLVKQYSELGQWTSAFFWADAAAAAGGGNGAASGDDIWLLASAMLARGENHRAAHAVVSRGLHTRHLLCLGVAMRAYLAAKEPSAALTLMDECDPSLLEPKTADQTHNRALGGVLVTRARALGALERREASAAALASALRADVACYEALDLLLEQHALTPRQESELLDSLPISCQLSPAEAVFVRCAYRERRQRYAPVTSSPTTPACPVSAELEEVRNRTSEAAICRARRLTASCEWKEALSTLNSVDPWCSAEIRATCLLELGKTSELFVFAHTLVNAYPNSWTSWFAVGCYYYLIDKSEFARRYFSKAKSLDPSVGCIWLAYGHSFAADNEHDQAMAAYFKASQLMPGCHLPPLYIGVECSLLNNIAMAQRFLLRAAILHNDSEAEINEEAGADTDIGDSQSGWERVWRVVRSPRVAHEAGCAAMAGGRVAAAERLWRRAAALAAAHQPQLHPRWAATLDALGHACRRQGRHEEARQWHEQALALRPAHAPSLAALGLALAAGGRPARAAAALHAALARDPDDALAAALLDALVDTLQRTLDEEDVPQFPFPPVEITPLPASPPPEDRTVVSDMSMSFD